MSYVVVVSYRNSTSNHNFRRWLGIYSKLYLIEILHQTTTGTAYLIVTVCCILSKFYIKPQPSAKVRESLKVVSYRNSTSNHNFAPSFAHASGLYLIEILHQTTTMCSAPMLRRQLYLIEILHQTTTISRAVKSSTCCILSKFYIKPQLSRGYAETLRSCILSKFYIKPQL